MVDIKWAVVCNNADGEATSVNLFKNYADAVLFTNADANDLLEEYKANQVNDPDEMRIEDYGEEVLLMYGGSVEIRWDIMPVNFY